LPILPIDTGRYGTVEMRRIFEEENRLQKMLDVEAALALAHAEVGNIPREDARRLLRKGLLSAMLSLRELRRLRRRLGMMLWPWLRS